MNSTNSSSDSVVSLGQLLRDAAVLAGVMAVVAIPVGLWAWQSHGPLGLRSMFAALAICWGSAVVSLLVGYLFREPTQAVSGMLIGMGIRAGLPMLFGIYMSEQQHPLAAAGLFANIMLFYLVGLSIETVLHVRQLARRDDRPVDFVQEPPAASQTS